MNFIKPLLTRGQIAIWLISLTLGALAAIYYALCPLLNTGVGLTIPLVLVTAKYQLLALLLLLIGLLVVVTYPQINSTFQKVKRFLQKRFKKKNNDNNISG